MTKLITALIVIGVCYGIYQGAMAANGWFQMSGVVTDVAEKELPGVIERRTQQAGLPSAGLDGEGSSKIRAQIIQRAEEANVPLRADAVSVGVVDNMLEVKLAWDAPIVVYNGKPYVEIPLTVEKRFSLHPRKGF